MCGFFVGDVGDFVWPDGRSLQWADKSLKSSHTPPQIDGGILTLFPKQKTDRTCLSSTGSKTNPKAERLLGPFTKNVVLEWVNVKCNTFIGPDGGLNYEGMHRESILQNLFHVSHISTFTMLHFDRKRRLRISALNNVSGRTGEASFKHPIPKRGSEVFYGDCYKDIEEYCDVLQSETASVDDVQTQRSSGSNSNNVKQEPLKALYRENTKTKSKTMNPQITEQIPQCERLSAIPTKGQFFHDYLKTSKPVIIEGATAHWAALHKWTAEFLRDRYGNKDVHIKLAPDGLFEGVDKAYNWEEFETFEIPANVHEKLPFPDLVVVRPATMNLKFSEFLDMIGNTSKAKRSNDTKPRYLSLRHYLN